MDVGLYLTLSLKNKNLRLYFGDKFSLGFCISKSLNDMKRWCNGGFFLLSELLDHNGGCKLVPLGWDLFL